MQLFLFCSIPWTSIESSEIKVHSQQRKKKGGRENVVTGKLITLLKKGLGERISAINSINHLNDDEDEESLSDSVLFGVRINPELAFNSVEKGPLAELAEESEKFRQFWGDKSQLRRFQDGQICETVYWPAKTAQEKRDILKSIIQFVLEQHAGINCSTITIAHRQLDQSIELPCVKLPHLDNGYGTGEEIALSVVESYNQLAKRLRTVDGIPLTVTGVQGISPALRGTEVRRSPS